MLRRSFSIVSGGSKPRATNFLKQANAPNAIVTPTNSSQGKYLKTFTPREFRTDGFIVKQHEFSVNQKSYVRTTIVNKTQQISPLNAVFVIDVSGSMNSSTGTDDAEMAKFSQLDLVRHQLETVLTPLDKSSQVGLVVFNHESTVLHPLSRLDKRTKKDMIQRITDLKPSGGTRMAPAMELAYKMINSTSALDNPKVVVLSDGMSENQDRILALSKRSDIQHIQTSTFGYGYEIDHKLLYEVASRLSGQFSRVPDHSMGLTNWVNWLTNSLWDYGKVVMHTPSGNAIPIRLSSNVPFSFIHSVQDRPVKIENALNSIYLEDFEQVNGPEEDMISLNVLMRQQILEKGLDTIPNNRHKELDIWLRNLHDSIGNFPNEVHDNIFIQQVLDNILSTNPYSGQFSKALDKKYLYKWGDSYMYSMMSGLMRQKCMTFKDPIFQFFGTSEEFIGLREELEEIMTEVPVPQPSLSATPFQGNFTSSTYQPSNPCVDGNMWVEIREPARDEHHYHLVRKQLKSLKKGDVLANGAKIECIVETKLNRYTEMVKVEDVWITPYHPVQSQSKWVFPCTLANVQRVYTNSVFSFVLDSVHVMEVFGTADGTNACVPTITWGHKIKGDPILEHEFFGDKIVEELQSKKNAWENGYMCITYYDPFFRTDEAGNKIISSFGNTLFE